MPKTNYANAKVQSALYGGASLGVPATWYLAWSTTTPNQDGSNFTEPSGNGYARVAITNSSGNFTLADNVPIGTTTWAASTAYAANATIRPSALSNTGYYYQCTTAGTSGSSAPAWPTTVGSTVTDGSAVWKCVAAQGKSALNAVAESFPQATGSEGTPTYIGVFDQATGGNLWEYEPITGASAIGANTTLTIPADDLSMYNN